MTEDVDRERDLYPPSPTPPPAPRPPSLARRPRPRPSAAEGDAADGVIPDKNLPALLACGLGVFSFIPCLGLPLGVAALILGLRGLKLHREQPVVNGVVPAWIGIICGSLFALFWLLILLLFLAGVISGFMSGFRSGFMSGLSR